MDDTSQRLTRCFAALFPDLDENEIQKATRESISTWDSVASVTLVNIVEEEFNIRIYFEDVEKLSSFTDFLKFLETREMPK